MTPDDHPQEVALARFAVIATLVTRTLSRAGATATRAVLLAMLHPFPGGERRITRRTLNRWTLAYTTALPNGTVAALNALAPIGRDDKGKPRVFKEEDLEEAIRLRTELTTRSTALLIEHLGNDKLKEATLAYHLRQRHATRKTIGKTGRACPRYEARQVNDTWQSDVKDGLSLPDPLDPTRFKEVHLIGFIDDHSRFVTHGEWYFKESVPCLFDTFKKAVIKAGRPSICYVDNGPCYRAKQFKLVVARLGGKVVYSEPYYSQGRGKVERFWQTVAGGFIKEAEHAGIQTLAELNRFFWGWLDKYNRRVHSSTGMAPIDRWEAGSEQVQRPLPADLAEAFLWAETRQVKKTGTFSLSGNEYTVDDALVGKSVEVRYDPLDLTHMRVYSDGAFKCLAIPAVLVTHTHRKATPNRDDAKYLPLPSSKRLLAARAAAREGSVEADLASLVPMLAPAHLDVEAWRGLLEEAMGRPLVETERDTARAFYERHGFMRGHGVKDVLDPIVERYGRERHLTFYLGELSAHMKARRS